MLPANLAGYIRKKVSSTSSALCFGCLVSCSPMRVFRQEGKWEQLLWHNEEYHIAQAERELGSEAGSR